MSQACMQAAWVPQHWFGLTRTQTCSQSGWQSRQSDCTTTGFEGFTSWHGARVTHQGARGEGVHVVHDLASQHAALALRGHVGLHTAAGSAAFRLHPDIALHVHLANPQKARRVPPAQGACCVHNSMPGDGCIMPCKDHTLNHSQACAATKGTTSMVHSLTTRQHAKRWMHRATQRPHFCTLELV
eukprot:1158800-Pelagomonas_calceolata.AAC.7